MADTFYSVNPRTGELIRSHAIASAADAERCARTARDAYEGAAIAGRDTRSQLLREMADRLRTASDDLHDVCELESALPRARIEGELQRTIAQLELFAALVKEGSYVRAMIDPADDAQVPPRPDVRRMLVPIGPVAVFGASNFPFAFGVAGGDTASALAAGCPVIAKGHPSQPGTNEMVAAELQGACEALGLAHGVFAHLQSPGLELGEALVDAPEVAAVGFTGSRAGGRALFDRAARRPKPIPVYAEMSSVNPIVVTDAALDARSEQIAEMVSGAITFAAGQLCTKPGVMFVPDTLRGAEFIGGLGRRITDSQPTVMLNENLLKQLHSKVDQLREMEGVEPLTDRSTDAGPGFEFAPSVYQAKAKDVVRNPSLLDERFGPVAVLVVYGSIAELARALATFEGELTATIHAEDGDGEVIDEFIRLMSERVGRVIFNGVPTGVAVTHAMQHGGPYPATTAPNSTSVGTTAVERFLRPVAYQDAPASVLPPELQDENPSGIVRAIDGELTAKVL